MPRTLALPQYARIWSVMGVVVGHGHSRSALAKLLPLGNTMPASACGLGSKVRRSTHLSVTVDDYPCTSNNAGRQSCAPHTNE